MSSPSHSLDAEGRLYYTEDVVIVDPLRFNPVLPFYFDLVRLRGLPSPTGPEHCTVSQDACSVGKDSEGNEVTRCTFTLSDSRSCECATVVETPHED